jgi:hypothetical protein
MQCFRIMDMPDRVIAFDELPARLLQGFELCRADGFPRHWKEWLGKIDKVTNIPPEKDPLTGQIRRFEPIIEKDSFFYLVDWTLNPVVEKWKEVCDFVRQHVDKDIRLTEKIDDMAKPLAANKSDGVTLEPEDVPVIPIPIQYQEKGKGLILNTVSSPQPKVDSSTLKCDAEGCSYEAQGAYAKNSLRMHKMKRHPAKATALA